MLRRLVVLGLLLALGATDRAIRAGETPPEGPPWVRTWREAKEAALRGGKPIFIYFTKTYCPHCVPVEENVLPNEALAPYYDSVVWVYACRNWRDDDLDLQAARIHDRFGVSSWPHLFVVDPRTDEILRRPGRSAEAVRTAFEQATAAVEPPDTPEALEEALAEVKLWEYQIQLLEGGSLRSGEPATQDQLLDAARTASDIVVRVRAARTVAADAPARLAAVAKDLLAVPSDPLRYAVLEALQASPDASAAPALAHLFRHAGGDVASLNPNVLRMHAAKCMIASGDASCLEAVAEFLGALNPFNGTSAVVVQAVAAIGERGDDSTRARAVALLRGSLPPAVEATPDPRDPKAIRQQRASLRLVTLVRDALVGLGLGDDMPAVPDDWNDATRTAWLASLPSSGE